MSQPKQNAISAGLTLCITWLVVFLAIPKFENLTGWHWRFVLTPNTSLSTLFTTHFFHANGYHLFANFGLVAGLLFTLRGVLQNPQIIAVWLVSAPVATAVSYFLDPGILVGASAGIMGILGAGMATVRMQEQPIYLRIALGVMVVICTMMLPGDAVAHISGLLVGYAVTRCELPINAMLWSMIGCTFAAVSFLVQFA